MNVKQKIYSRARWASGKTYSAAPSRILLFHVNDSFIAACNLTRFVGVEFTRFNWRLRRTRIDVLFKENPPVHPCTSIGMIAIQNLLKDRKPFGMDGEATRVQQVSCRLYPNRRAIIFTRMLINFPVVKDYHIVKL